MLGIVFGLVLGMVNYTVDTSQASMLDLTKLGFLKAPVVVQVNGEIDDMAADKFSQDVQAAVNSGEPVIPILIDSYGGSVYSFLRMADVLNSVKIPVATICIGKCMSAAAMLLGLGTEGYRYATPNSTVLLHEVSTWIAGKLNDIKNEAAETERLNKLIFAMVGKNCGKPETYFMDIISSKGHIDWFLTPEEAKGYNLVNHVKLPTIQIKVKTEMVLE